MTSITTIARVACGSLIFLAAAMNLPAAPGSADLSGAWQLNRAQSQFPREVAFGPQYYGTDPDGAGRGGGGRGGAEGAPIPNNSARPQSKEDVQKLDQLTAEIKNPPALLTISQTDDAVTIADGEGLSRTFRTSGKLQIQEFKAGPMTTVSTWTSGKLVVEYQVDKDRRVRYSYSTFAGSTESTADPRLIVEVLLLEKGRGTPIKRMYDPIPRTP